MHISTSSFNLTFQVFQFITAVPAMMVSSNVSVSSFSHEVFSLSRKMFEGLDFQSGRVTMIT